MTAASLRAFMLLLPLALVGWATAQVPQPSPPAASNAAQQPMSMPMPQPRDTTLPAQPTDTPPDRRGWPKPTADTMKFGLLLFDNLEYQGSGGLRWDMYGWHGGNYQRLWIKSEGSQATGGTDSDADLQLLYGKLISPFVDLQLGGRVASVWGGANGTARAFAVVGLQALTPYGFDIEPALFLSNKGKLSARFTGTYDVLFTQRLIFQPRLETNLAAQPDREFRAGAGFNDLEIGTRLRYEIRREFAPYLGVVWRQNYGETRTLQLVNGGERQGWSMVFGVRVWK